jgi:hypothetical protein
MNIVFLGGEIPSNRTILDHSDVKRVGVSYWGIVKRGLPKTKKYLLENYFKDDVEIYVHPGIPATATLTEQELFDFCSDYEEFIADNLHRLTVFTEVTHASLPEEFIIQQRASAWNDVDDTKFGVIYQKGNLESLATRYLNVFIAGDAAEALEPMCRKFSAQHGTKFHILGSIKPDKFRNSPFETTSTLAWLSPMMRGETIVWFANQLRRYPKRMKEQARSRYKAAYEAANLSFDKILADDAVEVSKLALWSYQQLETWANNTSHISDISDQKLPPEISQTTLPNADISASESVKLLSRNPAEMRTLPVLGVEVSRVIETDETGRDVIKDVPVLRSNSTSLRQCNSCFVKDNCPAFKVDNPCAFNLPVEVKTKEQLKGLINSLLEIQGQRVAFAKFAEDLNGGYPDPNTGLEMDRFFKMLKTIKELDESKEMMRVTLERGNSAGVLSSLFGERAQKLSELPNNGLNEDQTNEIIKKINNTDI